MLGSIFAVSASLAQAAEPAPRTAVRPAARPALRKVALILTVDDTRFVDRMNHAIETLKKGGWEIQVVTEDAELVSDLKDSGVSKVNLLKSGTKDVAPELLSVVGGDRLGKGDRALVYVLTHGYLCHESRLQCLDGGTSSRPLKIPVEQVHAAVSALRARGADVALVNNSCHSGGSIALGDPQMCVVTSTTHEGSSNESFDLFHQLKPALSLHEMFSTALGSSVHSFSPQVSSVVHQQEIQALRSLEWIHSPQYGNETARHAFEILLTLPSPAPRPVIEKAVAQWLSRRLDGSQHVLARAPGAAVVASALIAYRRELSRELIDLIEVYVAHRELLTGARMRELVRVLSSFEAEDPLRIPFFASVRGSLLELMAGAVGIPEAKRPRVKQLVAEYLAKPEATVLREKLEAFEVRLSEELRPLEEKLLAAQHPYYRKIVDQARAVRPASACSAFRL